jgi:DNA polymerase-1
MSRVFLVDGCQLVWRAVQKNAHMTNKAGLRSGCVVGAIDRLIVDLAIDPCSMAVVWDIDESRWRKELFPGYKATQKPSSVDKENVYQQMRVVQKMLAMAGVCQIAARGVEADDILGLLSSGLRKDGPDIVILAQDSDLHQLCHLRGDTSGGVAIYEPVQMRTVGVSWIIDKYGLEPWRLVDLFALSGGGGDDIPHIRGVGEKLAKQLIADFDSVEGVVAASRDQLPKGKIGDAIFAGKDTLLLAKRLVTIPVFGADDRVHGGALSRSELLDLDAYLGKALAPDLNRFYQMCDIWGCDHLRTNVLTEQNKPDFRSVRERLGATIREIGDAAPGDPS